jgi:hypothetical protein
MASGIFLITENNQLVEMQSSLYESEEVLQTLIAQFPRLLASCSEEEQDNAQWLLISREVGVPDNENGSARWSLDHLFIDSEGVPVLVEVKRSTDTRIRREVVGQMLDYAANAVAYWPIEHIKASYISECGRLEISPQDNLEQFLDGRIDEDAFWRKVKTNLQAGRIRMLFVADQIPNDLKRIIEFMNEQMDPAEVLGIEIRQFTDGKLKTIAPFVVGQTSGAETRKQSISPVQRQPREGLQEAVDTFNDLADGKYTADGEANNYRQIKIPVFPASMHYEFLHTKVNGVTAEFHIEAKRYASVSEELQAIAKEIPEINGGRVEFDPKWTQNKGRIRVIQNDKSTVVAATTMLKLIELTKVRIGKAITLCG